MKAKIAFVLALIIGLFVGFSVKFYKVNQASYELGVKAGADAVWHEAYITGNMEWITGNNAVTERRFINRLENHNPPEGRDHKYTYLEGAKEQIAHSVRLIREDIGLDVNPNR